MHKNAKFLNCTLRIIQMINVMLYFPTVKNKNKYPIVLTSEVMVLRKGGRGATPAQYATGSPLYPKLYMPPAS